MKNYKDQLEKLHQPRKEKSTVVSTRSSFSPKTIHMSSTGVFQKKCIFCLQAVKKHNNIKHSLISVATINFEENIHTYACWLDDNELLLRLGNSDFVAKEVMYHVVCRVNYQTRRDAQLWQ